MGLHYLGNFFFLLIYAIFRLRTYIKNYCDYFKSINKPEMCSAKGSNFRIFWDYSTEQLFDKNPHQESEEKYPFLLKPNIFRLMLDLTWFDDALTICLLIYNVTWFYRNISRMDK